MPLIRSSLLTLGLLMSPLALAKVPVTATFSILGDLVQQVGGDQVAVSTLVGPDGDAHVYQPTPQDIRTLAQSKLLVSNGLGFEGWLERLDSASGFQGVKVVASQGVQPHQMQDEDEDEDHDTHQQAGHDHDDDHHHHGGIDPHAWNNPANVLIYVDNIARGLSQVDPEHASLYAGNAARYKAKLQQLDADFRARFAKLPADRRRAITSHDAFGYLAQAYQLTLIGAQGLSTESEPSAAAIAGLIRQIRSEKIPALFVENISNPNLIQQIERETDARVGGELYSDALSPAGGEAATYLAMLEHNLNTLLAALEKP
ncbi:metal ABC transporter substrate-binding protein [Pseudaeromonas sharmana]|uniref:Metal ABC transporter substrate-binding protein n=1 Tax=Pseudaeromonas sharmana TaxID=328412 RepID=A0ABV8CMK2_9GAMM